MTFLKLIVPALFLSASATAAHAACDPSLEVVEIAIKNMKFVPAEVEVCVGQLVRWTSQEDPNAQPLIRHTVTFNPTQARVPGNVVLPEGVEPFGSGVIAPNQTYEYEFTVAGEYKYICRPHETMGHVGRITVVEP